MGSVGSVTPRSSSSCSSDLDPLTAASGVGQGRPDPASDSPWDRNGDESPSAGGSPISDQENRMPQRWEHLHRAAARVRQSGLAAISVILPDQVSVAECANYPEFKKGLRAILESICSDLTLPHLVHDTSM